MTNVAGSVRFCEDDVSLSAKHLLLDMETVLLRTAARWHFSYKLV